MINSYSKLPIGKWLDIQEANKNITDEVDATIATIAILADMTEDEVAHMPTAEFKMMALQSHFLTDVLRKSGRRLPTKYIIPGWELTPCTDYRKLEYRQYADFQVYAKDLDNYIVEMVSVILIPKGKRYLGDYDILQLQEDISKYMMTDQVFELIGFFMVRLAKSMRYFQRCSERLIRRMRVKALLTLNKNKRKALKEWAASLTSGNGLPL